MNYSAVEKLLDCIGAIGDSFLEEAETADIIRVKAAKRKRMAYGAAGIAVSVGLAVVAYWKLRPGKIAKSA